MEDCKNKYKCNHDWDIEIYAPDGGDCIVDKHCRNCGAIVSQTLSSKPKEG